MTAMRGPGLRATHSEFMEKVVKMTMQMCVDSPERFHTQMEAARADGVDDRNLVRKYTSLEPHPWDACGDEESVPRDP